MSDIITATNIYRVLLSRSRKGMVLFIPDYPSFDETYKFFKNIGINECSSFI